MGKQKLSSATLLSRLKDVVDINEYQELEKLKHKDLSWKAYDMNLLTEFESESCLNMQYSVVKSYLWSHLHDQKIRDHITSIVAKATRMYVVGSRFLGAWCLEKYEEGKFNTNFIIKKTKKDKTIETITNEYYDATLGDTTFLKHAFRGVMDRGDLHTEIATSNAFNIVKHAYPSINELKNLLELTAWNNVVGHLVSLYETNLKLHITLHIWNRILSYIKLYALHVLNGKVVTHEKHKAIKYNDKDFLSLVTLYKSIQTGCPDNIPEIVFEKITYVRSFFTTDELKEFPNMPKSIGNRLFSLHLFLRSQVPNEVLTQEEKDKPKPKKMSIVGLEAVPDGAEVKEFRSRGWTPVPIANLTSTTITIDDKIFTSLKKKLNIESDVKIMQLFGLDKTSMKSFRKNIRNRIKKKHRTADRRRARKSLRSNGLGCVPKGDVRSILTNGVSMCARYGVIKAKPLSKAPVIESLTHFYKRLSPDLIANDPGRVNIMQLTEDCPDGHLHMRFPRSKYKVVAMTDHLAKRHKQLKSTDQGKVVASIEANMVEEGGWKSRSKDCYDNTLKICIGGLDTTLLYYGQQEFQRLKMLSYRRKDSCVIQRFAHMIRKPLRKRKAVIIGYGSAGFAPTGKGETSVPTTRVAKLMSRYLRSCKIEHRIVGVDEFRTTLMCHHCHERTSKVRDPETGEQCRDLMMCENKECKCNKAETGYRGLKSCSKTGSVLLNRDANAAINILQCLKSMVHGTERPTYLQRGAPTSN